MSTIFGPMLRALKRAFCWAFNLVVDLCVDFLMWLLDLIPESVKDAIPTEFIAELLEGSELFLPTAFLLRLFGSYMGWRLSVVVFRLLFRAIRG